MNKDIDLNEIVLVDNPILDIIIAEPDVEPVSLCCVHLDSWQYGSAF